MGTPWKPPHSKFLGYGSSGSRLKLAPALPDVTEGIYATDEFRMYTCKVKKCSIERNHDWRRCPFTHTGESARRRDPKKYRYEFQLCPYFSRGICVERDQCGRAHGDYERGLHPGYYRTRLCEADSPCMRPICFFAHTEQELRILSKPLSPRSLYAACIAMGFEPAPSPVPDSLSTPVTLPESPSTIGISNNAPDNPLESSSSNAQNLPSQPSLSADSPSPETSTFSNVEDGLLGKKSRRYSDLLLPPHKSAACDQSSKTDSSPRQVNHSPPSLNESPSTTGIPTNDPDNLLEGLSSNKVPLPSQPCLTESPSAIGISNKALDNLIEGLNLNEQSLPSQPSLNESPSTIGMSDNAPGNPLEGSSSNEQSLLSQPSLSESPSTIGISNNAPDNTLEGLSSNEQSLPSQPSLTESPPTIWISNNAPGNPLEGLSSSKQSLPSQTSLSESPSAVEVSNSAPNKPHEGFSTSEQSLPAQPSLSESPSTILVSNSAPDNLLADNLLEGPSSNQQSLLSHPSLSESSSSITNGPGNPLEGPSSNQQSLLSQPSSNDSPSTTGILNNAPDNTREDLSSNEQPPPSQPSSTTDSPRPETSTCSNVDDGSPGKNYRRYDLFSPLGVPLVPDQSQKQKQSMQSSSKTYFSPNVNHSLPKTGLNPLPFPSVTTPPRMWPASPIYPWVPMPALHPRQTKSLSSSNYLGSSSSSAADNSLDETLSDVNWVYDLLDEPEESPLPTTGSTSKSPSQESEQNSKKQNE